jgi:hypothetical protein
VNLFQQRLGENISRHGRRRKVGEANRCALVHLQNEVVLNFNTLCLAMKMEDFFLFLFSFGEFDCQHV